MSTVSLASAQRRGGALKQSALIACAVVLSTPGCGGSPGSTIPNPLQDTLSCVGVPAVARGPAGSLDDVTGEAVNRANACAARASLIGADVVISYAGDALLAAAEGAPVAVDTDRDGSLSPITTGGATPPPHNEAGSAAEPVHAYAAYIAPTTGVQYTLSAGAHTRQEAQNDVAAWSRETLRKGRSDERGRASASASYDARAWTLIASGTVMQRYARQYDENPFLAKDTGSASALVNIYRLNTKLPNVDPFLVDVSYTQTPNWVGLKHFVIGGAYSWWNHATTLDEKATDSQQVYSGIAPKAIDFAPKAALGGGPTTLTVGAGLSSGVADYGSPGPAPNAAFSVTVEQGSVNTTTRAAFGSANVAWEDHYADVISESTIIPINPPTPAETIGTFFGERLAVYEVPASLNVLPNEVPGFTINALLDSVFRAYGGSLLLNSGLLYSEYSRSTSMVFAPEPVFAASPSALTVSKSANTDKNPAVVTVTAERPAGQAKITWKVVKYPTFVTINLEGQNTTGSAQLKVIPRNAQVGDSGTITLDSTPPGAASSLRSGPYQIPVTIAQ